MTRKDRLVDILSNSPEPVPGRELAELLGVSRQVVVQDVAILRARGVEVLATARGYMLFREPAPHTRRAVLATKHAPRETEEELLILVDHGVKVLDVLVEHPLYGELRGNLMLQSRMDVQRFLERVEMEQVSLLSVLTDGVHLHTVEYQDPKGFEAALACLSRKGYLITD